MYTEALTLGGYGVRPIQHARSSARGLRSWRDDLPVHEFLDATKFACADRRHRAVLHHVDLGAEITRAAFADRDGVDAIVQAHVREDLGRAATLADWFTLCDLDAMPQPVARRVEGGAAGVAARVLPRLTGGAEPMVASVCAFLFRPCAFLPERPRAALPLLMNCAGPMIVRRVFGPPVELDDGGVADPGWIAEAAIYTAFGRIPDLGEVVRCWRAEPTGDDQ
ncbi:DUF6915 family protein [Jannaschia formosa]|uniref:DUF6915 family protein n=1 Tax=Jannaschia formosa TaxID=2259592 RepID=UPI001074DE59|nr:hypothetical protein [Jannaschia formosa]TFL16576.1 hypothetical protein DR046_19460 [Jannaschia formosa]